MLALAQNSSAHHSGSNWGTLLLPVMILLVVFMFWSQRRRQKQTRVAQSQLQVGDEVSTTSGLFGRLVSLDDAVGTLEVAPGVQLRFDRRAIVARSQVDATRDSGPADQAAQIPASANVDLTKTDDPQTKAE
ncbi:preprotein translocase subunit YajC [Rudaeicoccus suwonensis]|uniref:Preprotein translocase subunit YajC n=1 Tax=Rudaeicoccus suwonensis TaxID=657409 RepID=A0A561EB97_9MICO|nr:preprotein translocase subunit YajC [Rudaeicoccus suwonensis]TWE12881.1 preprotein translocase subunit YajC [Rudaeicoccus suwonensis]